MNINNIGHDFDKLIDILQKDYLVSYASDDEDIILFHLLRNIKIGCYIDVGCWDPVQGNVSKLFYDIGWRGINIDALSKCIAEHNKIRPDDININIALSNKEETINFYKTKFGGVSTADEETVKRLGRDKYLSPIELKCITLNMIIEKYLTDQTIHFIKIDVEQYEKKVLEGLDLDKYRPYVVVVESTLPRSNTPSWKSWEHLMIDRRYKFLFMHRINRFYIAEEKFEVIIKNLTTSCPMPFLKYDHIKKLKSIRQYLD